jgi:hypothetical protein
MSDYTKTTNFAAKDSLPSGNAAKIVKGTEIDTEFNNIATAVGTKLDTSGYTAADVLSKLLTVDGTGTGLDADKVDGFNISTASSGTDSNTIYFRTSY